ncbi:unnamed protein product [Gordionus sp. m RMFG-2023]|uniref:vinculin-like isoform X1 n=1 Tax=Gordionus sp. m RMFG-2023 TaxID=3053472 RepID=UPI0030DFEBDA
MPSFHTKTIENILGPVADQVSRLVILHEEAEDGKAMPDLGKPIKAVSRAVDNLVRVGKDTYHNSEDKVLKQDMPIALHRVEEASKFLEQASELLVDDPFSLSARKKLIDGARGILQGTSLLLLAFDESEVRKIIAQCKKVLEYFAIAEVIENMEDLVKYVKDLTPSLTNVTKMVSFREKELTHQVHSEILQRSLINIKDQTPLLISSMKIYIQILNQGGKGIEESRANRNYLITCMSQTVEEIIRILQLTTYEEDESSLDEITIMKKALKAFESKLIACHDWLQDPNAIQGGMGEKAIRNTLENALKIASKCNKSDKDIITKAVGDISALTDALCELRLDDKGDSPQAHSLSKSVQQSLSSLNEKLASAVSRFISSSPVTSHLPHFSSHQNGVDETLNECCKRGKAWLARPMAFSVREREKAVASLMRVTSFAHRMEVLAPGGEEGLEKAVRRLEEMCKKRPENKENQMACQQLAQTISNQIDEYEFLINKNLTAQALAYFLDIISPLKHFLEAIIIPLDNPDREDIFDERAKNLLKFTNQISDILKLFANNGNIGKKNAEELRLMAKQIEDLTHQLVSAAKIKFHFPDNKHAEEHFNILYQKLSEMVVNARNLLDASLNSEIFIHVALENINHHSTECEQAFAHNQPQRFVENTSQIARLANRVLMIAKQESENSEDYEFHQQIDKASLTLNKDILNMVQNATQIASDFQNNILLSKWRDANNGILTSVKRVQLAINGNGSLSNNLQKLRLSPYNKTRPDSSTDNYKTRNPGDTIHSKSPLPNIVPPRPPPPETDDEDDYMLKFPPNENQPILQAAHSLHQDIRQWSSRDNEIIAAAKRMALFMAKLSQLVRGECGSKRDLIDCAKDIAESSGDVTRLAKELAKQCTDKRMRTNLLQVCERIPTIATQLKILSTVKATMLGAQAYCLHDDSTQYGSDEDVEATEMLVGNAQNLMQSVKETVKAAEAASIKIRTDSGYTLRWVRKRPWYQY